MKPITERDSKWSHRWSQHEFAVKIIEALGIPKEDNVTWFELRLDWSNDPVVTVQYETCPEPIVVGENNEIVKVLKECELVERRKEGQDE